MSETTTLGGISRPPTGWELWSDRLFRWKTRLTAILMIVMVFLIVGLIAYRAIPALKLGGTSYISGKIWDANQDLYGFRPAIWGTLYTSILALILATILGVSAAIVLNEHFLSDTLHAGLRKVGLHNSRYAMHWPDRLEYLVKLVIQLLAAIPSVVYGLWGIFVVIPWLRGVLARFEITLAGPSVLPASLVLAIMILPTITSIALDALKLVPSKARDAAHGLGATRWQALRTVVLPMASPGIVAGVLLGFGRALGETMALAMLSGNANVISYSVLQPANTLAALLANNFPEATNFQVSVLMVAALVLFTITICVNTLGNIVLMRANRLASRS